MNINAIILAAGTGSRLLPLTANTPKPLLDIGGIQPIVRMVTMLHEQGIEDITVVVGYQKEKIMAALGSSVTFREYADFKTKNNLHTLWSVRDKIIGDTLILYADCIFESALLKKILQQKGDICIVVDRSALRPESPRVWFENGIVIRVGRDKRPEDHACNFLGITKLSPVGPRAFVRAMETLLPNPNAYYSDAINVLIEEGATIQPIDVAGSQWIEIDSIQELEAARALIKKIS